MPETHSSLNSPLVYCRVTSIEPTWEIRATAIPINTRLCHLISSCSTKSVPVGRQHMITLKIRFIICFRSAGLVKNFVVVTFYERKENSVQYNLSNSCLLVQLQLLLYEPQLLLYYFLKNFLVFNSYFARKCNVIGKTRHEF